MAQKHEVEKKFAELEDRLAALEAAIGPEAAKPVKESVRKAAKKAAKKV